MRLLVTGTGCRYRYLNEVEESGHCRSDQATKDTSFFVVGTWHPEGFQHVTGRRDPADPVPMLPVEFR